MRYHLKAGALFAGIGGFCLGFSKAGIKSTWAVEWDAAAAKTYEANIQNVRTIEKDIRKVQVLADDLEPVDVLHAGFPCQSFSQAGGRKGFNDDRGQLFYEIFRLVEQFKDKKPKAIVLENSPYIKYGEGGSWFLEISKTIQQAGYWFSDRNHKELDTYSITTLPQKRNRLFMVAFSTDAFKNGRINFPETIDGKHKRLSDYIKFNNSIDDDSYYLSTANRYHKMISSLTDDRECIYQLRKYLVRVKSPNECPTLTANMGQGGHNVPFVHDIKGLRKLTEYECLKLQGFPDLFVFPEDVPRAKRYTQVGNSVSPLVTELLAKSVAEKFITELGK